MLNDKCYTYYLVKYYSSICNLILHHHLTLMRAHVFWCNLWQSNMGCWKLQPCSMVPLYYNSGIAQNVGPGLYHHYITITSHGKKKEKSNGIQGISPLYHHYITRGYQKKKYIPPRMSPFDTYLFHDLLGQPINPLVAAYPIEKKILVIKLSQQRTGVPLCNLGVMGWIDHQDRK